MGIVCFGQSEYRGLTVRYYLLEEETAEMGTCYGVELRCGDETETVPAITVSRQSAVTLLEALTRGCVTPVTVRDVVDDWLNR